MLRRTIYNCLLLSVISFLPALCKAQAPATFDRGMYVAKSDTMPYRILFPENFDPEKKYPLIIMLHGSGEVGNDNEAQLKNASWPFTKTSFREKYPAIVVFPQCPKNSFWSNVVIQHDSSGTKFNFQTDAPPTRAMHALMGLIAQLLDKPYINLQKVYIGGLSMGGMGTFEIIGREPKVFAAAFPMCGGDNTLNAKKYARKVPVWIFHGEKDDVVSPDHSVVMYEAIKAAGGDPKLTIIPNVGHQCWDAAMSDPDFMPWLFSHSRK